MDRFTGVPCKVCEKPLDTWLFDAECCTIVDATRGHYRVVQKMIDGITHANSSVRIGVRGLSDGSGVRLADPNNSSAPQA